MKDGYGGGCSRPGDEIWHGHMNGGFRLIADVQRRQPEDGSRHVAAIETIAIGATYADIPEHYGGMTQHIVLLLISRQT